MSVLFVNACVREGSRTLVLAHHLLEILGDEVTELDLNSEEVMPLGRDSLADRDKRDPSSPSLKYACQFADADTIVMAAPFWDLSIPALLKSYIENVCVTGITFTYENNVPTGLCKAKKLYFVTTSGGGFIPDFGYDYVKAVATGFFGIPETVCYYAEWLDADDADVDGIIANALEVIDQKENQ
ncbi:MAG: NAD(P)H-dependent oxidoreductase [Clostridia bacterium]|nr:NAD(P)H-dependent oxidoreductase [Clostridia bacterium]